MRTMGAEVGRVAGLWRYPVKSMRGERVGEAEVDDRGLAGDRAWALRDHASGLVLSAKRSARLLECAARYPAGPADAPEIELPDGRRVGPADAAAALSAWLGRAVVLAHASAETGTVYEIAVQTIDDIEAGVDQLGVELGDFPCPPGSFHDAAPLHVLTDATLAALAAEHPEARFDVRRFRPNVLVATDRAAGGAVEEAWVGRTLAIGGQVRASVLMGTIRCVMTTLAQEDLPRQPGVLRTVARGHGGCAGVYAGVELRGVIRVGDPVTLL
jgi:uncharacterized protein YcbX